MKSRLIQAESLRGLGNQLPRNLLLYDGHCVLCAKTTYWTLERNFGYINRELCKTNELWFATRQSIEGRRVLAYLKDLEAMDTVVLIEKIPRKEKYTRSKALIDEQAPSSHPVLGATTAKNPAALGQTVEHDLLISVKSHAVLRTVMKLDRVLWGFLASTLYYCVPRVLLDAVYDFVAARRYRWYGRLASSAAVSKEMDVRDGLMVEAARDFAVRVWKVGR